jgi:site-specific recombinase XerD
VVLTREVVRRLTDSMSGAHHLTASLLYGSDMCLMECVRLRVLDIDFVYKQIMLRDEKGPRVVSYRCRRASTSRYRRI